MSNELTRGELALDIAKLSVVEVVDEDMGEVIDQDDALRDLITRAEGNRAVGFTPETQCVEVRYVGVDSGDKTYTMPETRIVTSEQLLEVLRRLTREAGIADDLHYTLETDGENGTIGYSDG